MHKIWLYVRLGGLFCASMFLPTAVFNAKLENLWAAIRGDGDPSGPLP